jgi:hypothetical protein
MENKPKTGFRIVANNHVGFDAKIYDLSTGREVDEASNISVNIPLDGVITADVEIVISEIDITTEHVRMNPVVILNGGLWSLLKWKLRRGGRRVIDVTTRACGGFRNYILQK